MNQPTSTTFDITLADGEHTTVVADKVFVADGALVFSVAGKPILI